MCSPFIIALTALDESVLHARARSSKSAHRDVIRARIVLAAADGATNTEIAADVGVHVDTVRKWRRRFVAGHTGKDIARFLGLVGATLYRYLNAERAA